MKIQIQIIKNIFNLKGWGFIIYVIMEILIIQLVYEITQKIKLNNITKKKKNKMIFSKQPKLTFHEVY